MEDARRETGGGRGWQGEEENGTGELGVENHLTVFRMALMYAC